jgi:predicted Zn-dependent peptidase
MIASRLVRAPLVQGRKMSTMVATELFSHNNITVEHRSPSAAVVKDSKTASGIHIVSNDNGAASVGLTFSVAGGSRAESDSESGFSHILASTAFNGSSNSSPLRMIRNLENAGASFSASADRESIRYSVDCTDEHVHAVISAVADHITNPVNADKYYYVAENLEGAKLTAAAAAASGDAQLDDLLHEAAYGENSPLGRAVTNESAAKAEVCDIMAFRSRQFTAGNLTISASGLSHESLRSAVDDAFSGFSGAATSKEASPYTGGDLRVRANTDGVTYAGVAFPVPSGAAAGAFQALASQLSGLKGVAAFHHQYSDSGIFGVRTSGTPAETSANIQSAINAIKTSGGNGKRAALNAVDSADADGALMNAVLTSVPTNAAQKVSASDVSSAAKAALSAKPAYAVYGNTKGAASYADVQSWCK